MAQEPQFNEATLVYNAAYGVIKYLVVLNARMRVDVEFEVPLFIKAFTTNAATKGVIVLMNSLYVTSVGASKNAVQGWR